MIAIGPICQRNVVCANRWSSTGLGGVRSIMGENGHGSGQIAIVRSRCGCCPAWIGITGIVRQQAAGCGAITIDTSRNLKSP